MPVGLRRLPWFFRPVAVVVGLGLSVTTVPALAVAGPEPGAGEADEAPTTKAAILPLAVEGDELPEADRLQLTERLVAGLRRGHFDVIAPDEVLRTAPDAADCHDAGCYTAVARATGATHVVQAVVDAQDRDYEVEVVLVAGNDGTPLATSADSCQICGVAEVGDLIDAAAATLRTKLDTLQQGPATLSVTSTPPGARVSIDGELKGTTPFDAPVLAGKHVVRISLEGYIAVEREVTFVEGIEETQSFELEKVPSRLPPRPWGWVTLGLGVGSLGAAVAFTVLADRPYRVGGACDTPDAQGDCPRLWNTEPIVLGTAVAGGALVTLGVAILLNSARRRSKAETKRSKRSEEASTARRPRIGVGPGSVSIRGEF